MSKSFWTILAQFNKLIDCILSRGNPDQVSLKASEEALRAVNVSGEKTARELRASLAAREREVGHWEISMIETILIHSNFLPPQC